MDLDHVNVHHHILVRTALLLTANIIVASMGIAWSNSHSQDVNARMGILESTVSIENV
jgi:hypothetical protein